MKEIFWQTLIFAEVVQWIVFGITLFFILLPFIIIGLKHFRPTKWYHIILAYVGSFGTLYGSTTLFDSIGKFLAHLEGFTEIVFAIDDGYIFAAGSILFLWPLAVFYVVRLLKGPFTLLSWIVGLIIAIGFFIGLLALFFYVLLPWAFGQAFNQIY